MMLAGARVAGVAARRSRPGAIASGGALGLVLAAADSARIASTSTADRQSARVGRDAPAVGLLSRRLAMDDAGWIWCGGWSTHPYLYLDDRSDGGLRHAVRRDRRSCSRSRFRSSGGASAPAYGFFMLLNLWLPLSSGAFEGMGRYCSVLFPVLHLAGVDPLATLSTALVVGLRDVLHAGPGALRHDSSVVLAIWPTRRRSRLAMVGHYVRLLGSNQGHASRRLVLLAVAPGRVGLRARRCRRPPAASPPPTPAQRLASADALVRAGCLDCLIAALWRVRPAADVPAAHATRRRPARCAARR